MATLTLTSRTALEEHLARASLRGVRLADLVQGLVLDRARVCHL